MSTVEQPQTMSFLLGLNGAGDRLWEKACLPLAPLIGDNEKLFFTKANYNELIKQVVDYLDPDPTRFFEYTKGLPNFDNLVGFAIINQRPDLIQQIMEAVREFAVDFFFIASEYNIHLWPGEIFCSYADRMCIQVTLCRY